MYFNLSATHLISQQIISVNNFAPKKTIRTTQAASWGNNKKQQQRQQQVKLLVKRAFVDAKSHRTMCEKVRAGISAKFCIVDACVCVCVGG